ncbi:restriction endonuclease [Roseburia hominis]|uniref:restriction endonuclease n=1 Tax=Roseburia hominis TaxID=301301 RepID=UPI00267122BB|nr:hypothetical protein [Roseburia hominis]
MHAYELTKNDRIVLKNLGIDIIDDNRNYWLVRTQGGLYFDDFYFDGFIGIEWDEIVPENEIENIDELKEIVEEKYPDETRIGYVAGQIFKFVNEFKRGDIVIIPNKDSKRFAFGEITDDNIYIHELTDQDRFQMYLNDDESEKIFLKKRRKVNWIKTITRSELDPYLQTFIYAHNTIVDLNPYAPYIDRTLSSFYIKGEEAFFIQRVGKETNIPFDDLTDLFVYNKSVIAFVNEHIECCHIDRGDIISKVSVQSKGPVELKGPILKVLAIGAVCMFICGGHIKLNIKDGIEIGSDGVVSLIDSVINAYDVISTHQENREISELQEQYAECKEKLELYESLVNTEIEINEQ